MAATLYPKASEQLLQGGINLLTASVKAMLVDTALYTYNSAHEFLTSIPAGARAGATPVALTSKTVTDGAFDAADLTFTPVAAGATLEALVLYIDTGVEATSRLLWFSDVFLTGAPITPNGGGVMIAFSNTTVAPIVPAIFRIV